MSKLKTPLLFSLLLVITFSACKKDDDKETSRTKTEMITSASWKFDNAKTGGLDVSAFVPACWKDNIAAFTVTGSGTLDESTTVCDPSVAGSFTWSFQTNETILHLSAPLFPGGANDFKIVSITESNLVISQLITIPPNPSAEVVFTFKH